MAFSYILMNPFQYFLPYRDPVKNGFNKLKGICNCLWILTLLALLLNIIFGVIIYAA